MSKIKRVIPTNKKEIAQPSWHYIEDGEYPEEDSICWVACYLLIDGKMHGMGNFDLLSEPLYYFTNENDEPVWWNGETKEMFLPIPGGDGDRIGEKQWIPYAWAYANFPNIQIPYRKFAKENMNGDEGEFDI